MLALVSYVWLRQALGPAGEHDSFSIPTQKKLPAQAEGIPSPSLCQTPLSPRSESCCCLLEGFVLSVVLQRTQRQDLNQGVAVTQDEEPRARVMESH